MTRLSLKERLGTFLRKHYSQQFISSGELQRIVAEKSQYTPQNVGRRLRELENEEVVEVRYQKNHAYYRYRTQGSIADKPRRQLAWFEGLPGTAAIQAR